MRLRGLDEIHKAHPKTPSQASRGQFAVELSR
jgi:hypothetical protein